MQLRPGKNGKEITAQLYEHYRSFNADIGIGDDGKSDYYDEAIYREILRRWPRRDAVVCDLGCGDGRKLNSLAGEGFTHLYGCDIQGSTSGRAIIVRKDIMEFLSDGERSFDVIIANDVLEHFDKEEIAELLRMAERRLCDGGIVIVKVPNGSSPFFGLYQYGDMTHKTILNEYSIAQLSLVTGLKVTTLMSEHLSLRKYPFAKRVALSAANALFVSIMSAISTVVHRKRIILTPNLIAVLERRA